jgi:hypothetical protein
MHRAAPAGSSAAATTLLKMLIDPATPASVRVRAAECILNHSIKAIEIEEVEARVAAFGSCHRRPAWLGSKANAIKTVISRIRRLEHKVKPPSICPENVFLAPGRRLSIAETLRAPVSASLRARF